MQCSHSNRNGCAHSFIAHSLNCNSSISHRGQCCKKAARTSTAPISTESQFFLKRRPKQARAGSRSGNWRSFKCKAEARGHLQTPASPSALEPVADHATAFAPATIANLGPGFDWLGCAVDVSLLACINSYILGMQPFYNLDSAAQARASPKPDPSDLQHFKECSS